MAEFQVVMKQAKRMCAAQYHCHGCPLHEIIYANACNKPLSCMAAVRGDMIETLERIVTEWAAKHPEPRYPTWNEWYKATFPNSNYHTIPCPSMFYKICETSNYHGEVECYECKNSPIPADIAEKLGIKPIGGADDEDA